MWNLCESVWYIILGLKSVVYVVSHFQTVTCVCAHVCLFSGCVCMFCTSDDKMLVYSCGSLRCFCVPVDVNRRCWCVMSKGMHAVGQPEVVILLQCLPEEKRFPTDIFNHFIQIYWDAQTGDTCIQGLKLTLANCQM